MILFPKMQLASMSYHECKQRYAFKFVSLPFKAIDDKAWRNYAVAEARHRDLLDNLSHVQYTKYDPLKDGEVLNRVMARLLKQGKWFG